MIRRLATDDPAVTVVALNGDLDTANASALRTFGSALVAEPDCRTLVLDLGQVTFLDTAALQALITIAETGRDKGAQVRLRGAPKQVRRLLGLVGEDRLLVLEDP